jgi:hypothetical protein
LRAFLWMRALRTGATIPESSRPSTGGHAIDARVYSVLAEATDAHAGDREC